MDSSNPAANQHLISSRCRFWTPPGHRDQDIRKAVLCTVWLWSPAYYSLLELLLPGTCSVSSISNHVTEFIVRAVAVAKTSHDEVLAGTLVY